MMINGLKEFLDEFPDETMTYDHTEPLSVRVLFEKYYEIVEALYTERAQLDCLRRDIIHREDNIKSFLFNKTDLEQAIKCVRIGEKRA